MLKRELEEQNLELQRENDILRSILNEIDARLERHEHSIAYCVGCSEKIIALQESMEPFQTAVENWIGVVREQLEFQSGRISFLEERCERYEQSAEKHDLYYRGLTQTTRRFARYLKIFERKMSLTGREVEDLVGRVTELDRPRGFRSLWARWKELR